jgi:SpoU rRNA methylase family enzyme
MEFQEVNMLPFSELNEVIKILETHIIMKRAQSEIKKLKFNVGCDARTVELLDLHPFPAL